MHTTNYTTQNGQKNPSQRATPSLSIVHNYISAFTTNKPNTPYTVIYSLGVVAVFLQVIVWQFTVFHVAHCFPLSAQCEHPLWGGGVDQKWTFVDKREGGQKVLTNLWTAVMDSPKALELGNNSSSLSIQWCATLRCDTIANVVITKSCQRLCHMAVVRLLANYKFSRSVQLLHVLEIPLHLYNYMTSI